MATTPNNLAIPAPTAKPVWLPKELLLAALWPAGRNVLQAAFNNDFVVQTPQFMGLKVAHVTQLNITHGICETLWHIVSKEVLVFNPLKRRKEPQRQFDLKRAKKIPWCKPSIEQAADPAVMQWDKRESTGKIRSYVWLKHWDYVVILERKTAASKQQYAMLITAFYVDNAHKRSDFSKDYAVFAANGYCVSP
jgi:hypothetical protein